MMYGADVQLERLTKLGDPLQKLNEAIDWEVFREPIHKRIRKGTNSKGGRPPIDELKLFKITLLQHLNNLSDSRVEYLVNDRLSFQRFLNMELGEKSPDASTIWLFKQKMGKEGMRELFDLFNELLTANGVVKREGTLVDATFVEVPKPRNRRV